MRQHAKLTVLQKFSLAASGIRTSSRALLLDASAVVKAKQGGVKERTAMVSATRLSRGAEGRFTVRTVGRRFVWSSEA